MLTCPYNPCHRVSEKKYQLHVIKCKKNYKGVPKEICPYNAIHVLDANTFEKHLSNCPDKGPLDSLFAPSKSNNGGYLGVPPYRTHTLVENQQESWSSDEEQPDRNSSYCNVPFSVFDLNAAVDQCYKELMKTENQNEGLSGKESLKDNLLENNPQQNAENKPFMHVKKPANKYPFIGIGRGAPLIKENSPLAYNRALPSAIGRDNSTIHLSNKEKSLKDNLLENNPQHNTENKPAKKYPFIGIGRGTFFIKQNSPLAFNRALPSGIGKDYSTIQFSDQTSSSSSSSNNESMKKIPLENNSQKETKKLENIQLLGKSQRISQVQHMENYSQVSNISHDTVPFLGVGRGYRLHQILSNFNKESLNSSSLENDSQNETRSDESKNIPVLGPERGISLAKNNASYKSTSLQHTTTGCIFKSGSG